MNAICEPCHNRQKLDLKELLIMLSALKPRLKAAFEQTSGPLKLKVGELEQSRRQLIDCLEQPNGCQ